MTRHDSSRPLRRASPVALLAVLLVALGGCSEDDPPNGANGGGASADFSLVVPVTPLVLVEGDPDGLSFPVSLERSPGHVAPVTLEIEGATEADVAELNGGAVPATLGTGGDAAQVTLALDIADRPITPGQRRFRLIASDGQSTTRADLVVAVEPVDAPDVYLLIGQSNMVGSSGDGTRRAEPGGPDEPNPRVLQLNVAPNDSFEVFTSGAAYRSPEVNVVPPPIVVAEDPLHQPADPEGGSGKGADYIGLGLTFGKQALAETDREVVLVPAAWSGSAFCDNENGARGQWNARPTDDPALGNTWLFDRALVRANAALAESGGILRGILWHQGESDASPACAALYGENLALLARELRTRIAPDARGPALRAPDAPIPFVVGTMSKGVDERGDYSDFSDAKRTIDEVHRTIASRLEHAAVSIHDDLIPANGYPCGIGDCIHFGPEALREMGRRYHAALERALADP